MDKRKIQVTFELDQFKQFDILVRLLKNDIKVEVEGKPIFIWACEEGHTELVKMIVRKKIYVCSSIQMAQCIRLACSNGHTEIIRALYNHNYTAQRLMEDARPVNQEYDLFGNNDTVAGFLEACEKGHTEIVRIFLNAGMDATTKNNLGLLLASQNGHTKIAELLIKTPENNIFKNFETRKKNVLARKRYYILDKEERDLLDQVFFNAVYNGHTEILRLLLEVQKELYEDYRAASLNDLLVNHASYKGHTQMVEMLVDAGINRDSGYVKSALTLAKKKGYMSIANILKKSGVKEQ